MCVAAAALLITGCGTAARTGPPAPPPLPADEQPIPIGIGPAYRISPTSPAVARRQTIAGLRCARRAGRPAREYAIHLELFAHRKVVPVPAGIGIAPPLRRSGAYVLGGACAYPLRTLEPTGVVRIDGPHTLSTVSTVSTLFMIWGQPLTRSRLATFTGPVHAFVDGTRRRGDPGSIRLTRHAEIVLEVDGYVPPHPRYAFPPGL